MDALAAVCACLKICFLEMLEPAARDALMVDLMGAHRRALSQAQAALSSCPCRCVFVQRCLARDVERWEAELIWLEALGARSRRRGRGGIDGRGAGMVAQDDPGLLSVADLNVAEQFVLWAVRTRLEGAASASISSTASDWRMTSDGGAGLAAFESWFQVLATHCWRDLYLHRAPCPCLSADERTMLDLVASAQVGDERRLHRAAAVWFSRRRSRLAAGQPDLRRRPARAWSRLSGRPLLPWRSAPATLH